MLRRWNASKASVDFLLNRSPCSQGVFDEGKDAARYMHNEGFLMYVEFIVETGWNLTEEKD